MLEDYTVKELHQLARNKNLKGYSQLNKADLIKFIKTKKSPKKSPKKSSFTTTTKDKIMDAKKDGIDWFIITMDGCGYCDEAKKLLKQHKLPFKTQMITEKNKDKIYESIDPLTKKYRYFPVIFYKGKFIGGFKELKQKLEKK
jgi:glutaredoxin